MSATVRRVMIGIVIAVFGLAGPAAGVCAAGPAGRAGLGVDPHAPGTPTGASQGLLTCPRDTGSFDTVQFERRF